MKSRQHVPRYATYLMHVQRGPFTIFNRNTKQTYTVDTTPAHAKAMTGYPISKDGVVLPIRNNYGPRKAKAA